ncbi:MAG TPA: contractile injection system protein, VgrG/Pvc8 family [Polyangiaceae bacterium]|nr:contractile injection system protein, VgrG/Pvc8 family [Polyangiaceae bacterium]
MQYSDSVGRTRIQPRPANLPKHKPAPQPSAPLFLYFALQAPDRKWVGSRYFELTSFKGNEGVSSPFEFQLELRANSAPVEPPGDPSEPWPTGSTSDASDWALSFEEILGRAATVGIARPTPEWPATRAAPLFDGYHQAFLGALQPGAPLPPALSLFNGVLASFSFEAPGRYTATLRPWLWQLTLTNHYRVLHGSVVEVIAQVLAEHGLTEHTDLTSAPSGPQFSTAQVDWLGRNRRQDWFQAGESDYAFVQRLMGKANVYYYFEQGARGHTVVFSNTAPARALSGASGPSASSERANTLRYAFTSAEGLGLEQEDVVSDYRYEQSLRTTAIRASFVRQPPVWESNEVASYAAYTAQVPGPGAGGPRPFHVNRIYPYGGTPADHREEARRHAEQQEAMLQGGAHKLSGSSKNAAFRVGRWFLLSDGERNAKDAQGRPLLSPELVRPSLQGRRFVLTSVQHEASSDGSYQNSFESRELTQLLTSFDARDTEQGSVLAEVVARSDEGAEWRAPHFLPPSAFDFSKQAPQFEGLPPGPSEPQPSPMPGVLVRLCTQGEQEPPLWVKLSDGNPSAPQVGSLVLVGRARDYSEMPEIQQVVDSHGSIVVMPQGARGLRWQSNTSIGSNHSTSYGDSQSVRYGGTSPGTKQLAAAVSFVRDAYAQPDQLFADGGTSLVAREAVPGAPGGAASAAADPGPRSPTPRLPAAAPANAIARVPAAPAAGAAGSAAPDAERPAALPPPGAAGFKDVSYSQGSSCSFAESDAGADGLLSRSFSRGSSWNSSISAWSRSYSITGSASERQQHDASATNAFEGIAQGSQSWVYGDSASLSLIAGRQLNASAVGDGAQLPPLPTGCVMGSHSVVVGDSKSISEVRGNSSSSSTTIGDSTSSSLQNGTRSSTSVLNGAAHDESTITGPSTSRSTLNTQDSTVTGVAQSSTSTFAATSSTSTVGVSQSTGLVGVNTSTSLSGVESSTRMVGATGSIGLTGAAASLSLTGASHSVGLNGASSSVGLTGASDSVNLTGASSSVNLTGASTGVALTGASSSVGLTGTASSVNLTGSSSSVNLTGSTTSLSLTGSARSLDLSGLSTSIRLGGSSTSINLSGTSSNINLVGSSNTINLAGSTKSVDISPGGIECRLDGTKVDMITMQIIL